MYFINEKAGEMSASGCSVKLETGLPALHMIRTIDSNRKIIIWRDICGNIHVETVYNDISKIIEAIRNFERGKEYWN